jgi:hypothetical protein
MTPAQTAEALRRANEYVNTTEGRANFLRWTNYYAAEAARFARSRVLNEAAGFARSRVLNVRSRLPTFNIFLAKIWRGTREAGGMGGYLAPFGLGAMQVLLSEAGFHAGPDHLVIPDPNPDGFFGYIPFTEAYDRRRRQEAGAAAEVRDLVARQLAEIVRQSILGTQVSRPNLREASVQNRNPPVGQSNRPLQAPILPITQQNFPSQPNDLKYLAQIMFGNPTVPVPGSQFTLTYPQIYIDSLNAAVAELQNIVEGTSSAQSPAPAFVPGINGPVQPTVPPRTSQPQPPPPPPPLLQSVRQAVARTIPQTSYAVVPVGTGQYTLVFNGQPIRTYSSRRTAQRIARVITQQINRAIQLKGPSQIPAIIIYDILLGWTDPDVVAPPSTV